MQFLVLSDVNATWFTDVTSLPIFRDPSTGRVAWTQTQAGATKHDTFVYGRDGIRTLVWDASRENLDEWAADIRVAVEAHGK